MKKYTIAEFRKIISPPVSYRAVQKAIETGRIKQDTEGYIDESQLKKWYSNRNPAMIRKKKKAENTDKPGEKEEAERKQENKNHSYNSIPEYDVSRARKEHYNANLAELENEVRKGELVSKKEISEKYFTICRNFRDQILSIPNRIGASFSSHIINLIREEMKNDFNEEQIEKLMKKLTIEKIEFIAFKDLTKEHENALNELQNIRKKEK